MNHRELSLAEALVRSHIEATSQRKQVGSAEHTPPRPPFTIAVSREAGALGNAVANEVGRRLDWPVYDKEILEKIAEEIRRPTSRLEPVDEQTSSWLEECLSALMDQPHVSADTYFKYLNGVVRGLGAAGRCVIVGRAANFILPAETTLRVRLVASLEDRVQTVAHRQELSNKEAAAWVESTERRRLAFVQRYFAKDAADPHHYDMVLNMSRLSVEGAGDVIIQALRQMEACKPSPATSKQA